MENTNTIPSLLDFFVTKYKSKLLFQRRDGWSWKQLTWLDFDTEIKNISSFLLSLDFKSGDKSIFISSNCNECVFCELAIYYLGGVVIPFEDFSSFSKHRDFIKSVNPKFLFIEKKEYLDELKKDNSLYDGIRKIFIFSDSKIGEMEKVIPYKGLVKFGQLKKKEYIDLLKTNALNVVPDQYALNIFSKNGKRQFIQSEINQIKIIEILRECQSKLSFITKDDQAYSYMNNSSIFGKLINLLALTIGMRLVIAEDRESFYSDILEVKPTVLFEGGSEILHIYESFKSSNKPYNLKSFLGGRLKYIITESMPLKETIDPFNQHKIEILELPQLREVT